MSLHQSQVGRGLEEGSWCPTLKGLQAISVEEGGMARSRPRALYRSYNGQPISLAEYDPSGVVGEDQ